jgi:hypothetical protein
MARFEWHREVLGAMVVRVLKAEDDPKGIWLDSNEIHKRVGFLSWLEEDFLRRRLLVLSKNNPHVKRRVVGVGGSRRKTAEYKWIEKEAK